MKLNISTITFAGLTSSSIFATAATSNGGDCYAVMMAANDYYSNVVAAIQTDDSHGDAFTGRKGPLGGQGHTNRMAMFDFNMRKWGQKLDEQNCECPQSYTLTIAALFNPDSPIGNLIV